VNVTISITDSRGVTSEPKTFSLPVTAAAVSLQ
jgi:hypothetical protein